MPTFAGLIFALIICLTVSCTNQKQLFVSKAFSDGSGLTIDQAEKFELQNNSRKIIPDYVIDLDEGIYPNVVKHPLEAQLIFKRRDHVYFQLETNYYYSPSDSLISVILYEWNDLPSSQNNTRVNQEQLPEKFRRYQLRFNQLRESLITFLGKPSIMNIEHGQQPPGETFRDDVKWKNDKGMNAYLFMFGNDQSGFREIRLALYEQ